MQFSWKTSAPVWSNPCCFKTPIPKIVASGRLLAVGVRPIVVATMLLGAACTDIEPTTESGPAVVGSAYVRAMNPPILPSMEIPADNPMSPERAALGMQLFFDTRLSDEGQTSCETCHLPELGWTDGKQFSTTHSGSVNSRHTPTLYNVGYYTEWYWDGRAPTLEAQVLAAWRSQVGATPEDIALRISGIPEYREQFQVHMNTGVTPEAIVQAVAAFVRTLVSADSPWDRYELGDETAVSEDAVSGFEVFSETANCALCHLPPLLTDTLYHNIGIGFDGEEPDMGRGAFLARTEPSPTEEAARLQGAFKTPTLRSITETAPYFHDGSAETLEAAVDFVLGGGHANAYLDEKLKPKELTAEQRSQLLAFLRALTPDHGPFQRPTLPN
jgi:cytochrome c peroxidase